jgi:serine phosphatase RsbU (regulator of sigma subunit)
MSKQSVYNSDIQSVSSLFHDTESFRDIFIIPVAENLFDSFHNWYTRIEDNEDPPRKLKYPGKSGIEIWYNYVAEIPRKYKSLDLIIRSYADFCPTCLITDKEVSILVNEDLTSNILKKFIPGVEDPVQFYTQLNYLIPFSLKKAGYEVVRYEQVSEIGASTIKKLARAIHSRYLSQVRTTKHEDKSSPVAASRSNMDAYTYDFDDLPDEIKNSNIDNAAHIPIKLLSIGYKIRQVKKGFKPYALHLNEEEIETMARVEHLRWSWEKRLNSWNYGNARDEVRRTHPGLIPYEDLSESEKAKDRELVKLIPGFLQDIDYEAYPVSPNIFSKLSYAIKPQSIIHKILSQTRELNEQIKNKVKMPPELEEIVRIRNSKIEEAITEVEAGYNYARHIQEIFLPDDLYIRECFPNSFVLYKPKDIVSGDFYFFSKRKHRIIFAAADCTGHGIPGALLSTLGYGILDQVVNEIRLTDPALILHHLYLKMHRYLRNDEGESGIKDDMDIMLCVLDTATNVLTYSGVKNPLYLLSDGKISEYQAQNSADENYESKECQFSSSSINLENSDIIYLFSDGYADQFGGKKHKKYQLERFRKFLESISDFSMPEQSDLLYGEIEKWKEENNEDQTDDILVIGIRI